MRNKTVSTVLLAAVALIAWGDAASAFYAPRLGRWLTRDPIGEKGGAHLYTFARNGPVDNIDALGELTITTTKAKKLDCGGRDVYWLFTLDKPAPCDGYFVQKVTSNASVSITCATRPPRFRHAKQTFWEAFGPVSKGDTRIGLQKLPGAYTDNSHRAPKPGTRGLDRATGEVRFYCSKDCGDLNAEWEPGRDQGIPSGYAPSTKHEPSFWKTPAIEGPAYRAVTSSWDCCCWSDTYNELLYHPE